MPHMELYQTPGWCRTQGKCAMSQHIEGIEGLNNSPLPIPSSWANMALKPQSTWTSEPSEAGTITAWAEMRKCYTQTQIPCRSTYIESGRESGQEGTPNPHTQTPSTQSRATMPSIQYQDSIKAEETELSEAEVRRKTYSPTESVKPWENTIWNQYNIMCEGWEAQLTNTAQIHILGMMKMMGQVNTSPDNYTKLYLCALLSLAQEYAEWKALSWLAMPIKSPSPITIQKMSPPKHPSNPQGTTPVREHHPMKQEEIVPPVDLVDSVVCQVHASRKPGKQTTPTTNDRMHCGMHNI